MRLLYVALDQQVPGTLGGSVHVQAVAEGLAKLGHEVHVAAQKEDLGSLFGHVADPKRPPRSFVRPQASSFSPPVQSA